MLTQTISESKVIEGKNIQVTCAFTWEEGTTPTRESLETADFEVDGTEYDLKPYELWFKPEGWDDFVDAYDWLIERCLDKLLEVT